MFGLKKYIEEKVESEIKSAKEEIRKEYKSSLEDKDSEIKLLQKMTKWLIDDSDMYVYKLKSKEMGYTFYSMILTLEPENTYDRMYDKIVYVDDLQKLGKYDTFEVGEEKYFITSKKLK